MEPIIHYRVYKLPMNTQTSHTNPIHTLTRFRDSVVDILIMLRAEWWGARIPVRAEIFLLQNVQTGAGVHPPYLMRTDRFHGGGEAALA